MSKKRPGIIGIILAVAAVAAVFYAEQVLQPVYAVKSLCKVAAFGSTVWIYKLLSGERILSVICLHKMKHATVLLISMLGCFFGIPDKQMTCLIAKHQRKAGISNKEVNNLLSYSAISNG